MKKIFFAAATALLMLVGNVSAQGRPEGRPQMNPEEFAKRRTEHLTKQLELNEEQSKQVYAQQLNQMKQMQQLRQDQQTSREQMREKMHAARQQQDAEMKQILTDEQYKKWQQLQQEGRHRRPNGPRGEGGQHPHRHR